MNRPEYLAGSCPQFLTTTVSVMPPATATPPTWVLEVPFEQRQALSSQGVRWDKDAQAYIWRGPRLPTSLSAYAVRPFSLGWHRQYHLNHQRHLEPLMRATPAFLARPHQNVAIDCMEAAYLDQSPGFVLADEVGVGKTMSCWGLALRHPEWVNILIVTTAPAQAHWRHTVLHAGWCPGQRILIINYDQLGKVFALPEEGLTSNRRKGKRKRVAKQGQAPVMDLVIFDESHKGKSPHSARGIMMRKIAAKAKFCVYASATIGQNPADLGYVAPVLGHVLNERIPSTSTDDFVVWCQRHGLGIEKGPYGSVQWNHAPQDVDAIQRWIFQGSPPVGLRRLPQNVANWPALERQIIPMELPPAQRQAYAKVWEDFVRENIKAQSLPPAKKHLEEEKNKLRLRQETSWLRIPLTVQQTMDLLEQNKKVAISVAFLPTLHEMAKQLRTQGVEVSCIEGSLSALDKETQRLAFQHNHTQVVIFTVEESISLHQGEYGDEQDPHPRVLLVHDLRWSSIQMSQIEGRCHRDGKLAPTWWLGAIDTVDMDIMDAMMGRMASMKAMHGDSVDDLKAIGAVLAKKALDFQAHNR